MEWPFILLLLLVPMAWVVAGQMGSTESIDLTCGDLFADIADTFIDVVADTVVDGDSSNMGGAEEM